MTRYAAFLRAINAGGRIITMDVLRAIVASLGFTNVQTFIQSGNVIFETDETDVARLEERLESALTEFLAFLVPAYVRTMPELRALAASWPFPSIPESDDVTLYVAFLPITPPLERQQKLLALASEVNLFHIERNHVFWLRQRSLEEKPFSAARIEKALAMEITVRNISTIRRMAQKYA